MYMKQVHPPKWNKYHLFFQKSDMLEMRTVGNKDHESSPCAVVSVLKSYSMRGTRGAVRLCSVNGEQEPKVDMLHHSL